MSTKKLRFRPTVQTLENRRCLAGALGIDEVAATPEEPARGTEEIAIIATATIAGVTAPFDEGGGLFNDVAAVPPNGAHPSEEVRAGGGVENHGGSSVRVAAGDVTPDLEQFSVEDVDVTTLAFFTDFDNTLKSGNDGGGGVFNNGGHTLTTNDAGIFPSENHDAMFSEVGHSDDANNIIAVLVGL